MISPVFGHPESVDPQQTVYPSAFNQNKQKVEIGACADAHTGESKRIRFFNFSRRIRFHINLSIMHEVIERRPRSESVNEREGSLNLPVSIIIPLCPY